MREQKKILFISSNQVWSGSEELWYNSAERFLQLNFKVGVGVYYEHPKIDSLKIRVSMFMQLKKVVNKTLYKKVITKILEGFKKDTKVEKMLQVFQPDLVIISQGNNIDSVSIMSSCFRHRCPFTTVTQLVSTVHFLFLDEDFRKRLIHLYDNAKANFFVSQENLEMHQFMLGYRDNNATVVYNPSIVPLNLNVPYLSPKSDGYKVAFVGRIECYHKGLDLLIKVITLTKWQSRPISFHFYGNGPHVELLKDLCQYKGIANIIFHGNYKDIESLWSQNHIMILPSRMEGQSLALIEAFYCNRAAIVTNVGGANDLVLDGITGFLANEATELSIDQALERAWQNRSEWENIGLKAGQHIRSLYPEDAALYFNNKILAILNSNIQYKYE
jgi:glycosyltransferase involved in cell wall biosynthesis